MVLGGTCSQSCVKTNGWNCVNAKYLCGNNFLFLIQALQDEGLDPEEFYFETCEKKSPMKRSVGSK